MYGTGLDWVRLVWEYHSVCSPIRPRKLFGKFSPGLSNTPPKIFLASAQTFHHDRITHGSNYTTETPGEAENGIRSGGIGVV